ncbi:MAG: AAA family ATPase [Firmicutes bacterium]|nr:AAA family ATPase [Bacillota bacterium]
MYSTGRYFTVTGNIFEGRTEVNKATHEIKIVHEKYFTKSNLAVTQPQNNIFKNDFSEDEILEKARNAENCNKFNDLFNGTFNNYYQSQSEADIGLCNILAFWCGNDVNKIDSLFRRSELMRSKWDEMHGNRTYGQITIGKSIEITHNQYDAGCGKNSLISQKLPLPPKDKLKLNLICMDNVQQEDVKWLWKPYIPFGKITVLQGDPGLGKTFLALRIAATISAGGAFPPDDEESSIPFNVIFQTAEALPEGVKAREEGAKAFQNGIEMTAEAIKNVAKATADGAKKAFDWATKAALENFTLSKGGDQNVRDTGLADVSDAEIERRLKDPNTSKEEKRKLQKEQKGRGNRNRQKRGNR